MDFPLILFPKRKRREAVFLFEDILKIRLGRETEVFADLADRTVRVEQQAPAFFQLPAHDEIAQIESQFFFELSRDAGAAFAYGIRYVSDADGLVGVGGNVLDAGEDIRRDALWNLAGGYPVGEIHAGGLIQAVYLVDRLRFLGSLNIDIA